MLKDIVLFLMSKLRLFFTLPVLSYMFAINAYADEFDLRIVHGGETQNIRVNYSSGRKLTLSHISTSDSVIGSDESQSRIFEKPSENLEANEIQILKNSLSRFNPCLTRYPNAEFDASRYSVNVSPSKSWIAVDLKYRKLAVYDRDRKRFTDLCENGWKGFYWNANSIGIAAINSSSWRIETPDSIKLYSLSSGEVKTITFDNLPILNFILLDRSIIVAVVETSSRTNLLGFLAALAGHGMTKRQLELRVWDPNTNIESKKDLGEFDNPAVFMTSTAKRTGENYDQNVTSFEQKGK